MHFGKQCNTLLRKETRKERDELFKKFLYQDINHWIAWMFCREDIAKALEWDPFAEKDDNPEVMSDIWDGSILRDFRGPDGKDRFVVKLPNERRLVFSFNYDSLNPYGNRIAGKAVKIGGMYMACLNLPRRLRFLVENVFLVGVVPGPDGPSNSEINGCLRPLVDDLVTLWKDGIFLSRTPLHPLGLRVRCALIPLVCDLPAARQISGTASGASDGQCNECHIVRQDMENLDYKTWPKRDSEQHRNLASRWRDASSAKLQEKYFKESHVRWSELLRLPYWCPTRFVTIDSMHGLYLGMFQRHCRIVWGMDSSIADGDGVTFDTTIGGPAEDVMTAAEHILRFGTQSSLEVCPAFVLRQLCREHELRYGKKLNTAQLQTQLLAHVSFEFESKAVNLMA